jgi:hypothetical protein
MFQLLWSPVHDTRSLLCQLTALCRGNPLVLYWGCVRFESRSGHQLYWGVSWFTSVPPGKWWDSTSIRPRPLPPTLFPIHPSPIILPYDAMRSRYWKRRYITHEPGCFRGYLPSLCLFATFDVCPLDQVGSRTWGVVLITLWFRLSSLS